MSVCSRWYISLSGTAEPYSFLIRKVLWTSMLHREAYILMEIWLKSFRVWVEVNIRNICRMRKTSVKNPIDYFYDYLRWLRLMSSKKYLVM